MKRFIILGATASLAVWAALPARGQGGNALPGPPEVTEACGTELELGDKLLAKNDPDSYEAAAESFQSAIDAQYDCVPALIGYAQAITLGKGFNLSVDEYTNAYIFISRALTLDPKNSRAYWVMGDLMRHTNRPQLAIAMADRSLVINPDNPWGHYVLGSAVIGMNNEVAIQEFEKALALKPDWNMVRLNLAAAYIGGGMLEKAEAQLELYLQVRPEDEKALTNMGLVHYMLGDMDGARGDFERALEIRPGFTQAQRGLGDVELAEKKYESAAELYNNVLQNQPGDAVIWAQLGRAQQAMGDMDKARESCRKALKLDPENEEAKNLLEFLPTP